MPAGSFNLDLISFDDFEKETRPEYSKLWKNKSYTPEDIDFVRSQFEKQFSGETGWEQNKAVFWPNRNNIMKHRKAMAVEYSERLKNKTGGKRKARKTKKARKSRKTHKKTRGRK